jgi:phosphoadenosine phosphosulfate reductase
MVKKQLKDGSPCEKCAQTEEMLRRRGLWERIDDVVWAVEGDAQSAGGQLGQRHGVEVAPFFVILDDSGEESVVTSGLKLVRRYFPEAAQGRARTRSVDDLASAAHALEGAAPDEILRWGLERHGDRCAIAFRGGEDVVLIDMAVRLGLPFRVFNLETGRLHAETYVFLDDVRRRYGVTIEHFLPDAAAVSSLLREKGPNSFYLDGHQQCCAIRKLAPLRRAVADLDAWVTGRLQGSLGDSVPIPVLESDRDLASADRRLLRLNPLARWTRDEVLGYIRENDVPYNPLHDRGYVEIDCEPCTRAISGDQPSERGRWWWEDPSGDVINVDGDGI